MEAVTSRGWPWPTTRAETPVPGLAMAWMHDFEWLQLTVSFRAYSRACHVKLPLINTVFRQRDPKICSHA